MATWHIPLHNFDDALEELFDLTFPPGRYLSLGYDWPLPIAYNALNKRIGRHRGLKRKRQENSEKDEKGFLVELNVKHYKPDEITLKVEGQTLTVQGKHEHESENGFEKSEFRRQYALPQDVDNQSLTSKITQDGILCIEAAKLPKALLPGSQDLAVAGSDFQLALDVSGYKPEEISVKVVGRNLIIHGEAQKEKEEGNDQFVHHKQFTRQMNIPEDVDISCLSTTYNKEGKIIVEAPRIKAPAPIERHLELKVDVDSEKKLAKATEVKGTS